MEKAAQRRILDAVKALADDPYSAVHDVKQLSGRAEYRLRMGDYRVIYVIDESRVTITVAEVAHRREAYR